MSDSPDSKPTEWRSPQVVLPIIATVSTILVAIIGVLPSILEASKPPVTPTPFIVLVATPVPTSAPLVLPSDTAIVVAQAATDVIPAVPPTQTPVVASVTPLIEATAIPPTAIPPTDITAVAVQPTAAPNITLFYDNDSFTVWTSAGSSVRLTDVSFRSSSALWEMSQWGSLVRPLPNDKCLRLRDALIGERQPPAECTGKIHGFFKVGHGAIFWRGVEQFEVVNNGSVIATCAVAAGTCPIYIGG